MKRDKSAITTFEMIYWIARAIFLIIVIVSVVTLVRLCITTQSNTEELEANLLVNHFLYSPDSIVYYDEFSGRPMLGIVDTGRLNDMTLDSAFSFGDKNTMLAAKIEIYDFDSKPVKFVAYYNKPYYDGWFPLTGESGAGAVSEYPFSIYTLYSTPDGKINKGIMNITVLIPKS